MLWWMQIKLLEYAELFFHTVQNEPEPVTEMTSVNS